MEKEYASVDAYWRAANYLTTAQIFLRENSLLSEPLSEQHVKPRLLGHWGTCPGLNFVYAHLNRIISETDEELIYIAGPGHGGAAVNSCAFLDGAYLATYSDYSYDKEGIDKLVSEFSWPGGSSSHVSPYTPGSIHEGGELGYALGHAFGAVLDNPGLTAVCVVGDGEAETGPTAASWHANKFLNPEHDGAVLPVLHLNEYKIASPTLFSALREEELESLFSGYGYTPIFVEGSSPQTMHEDMAEALDKSFAQINDIRSRARELRQTRRHRWPLIILRTPKGWTGPQELDDEPVEGSFRSHQVPLGESNNNKEHLRILDNWLQSYEPAKLFGSDGTPSKTVKENVPREGRRMSLSPYANGGSILKDLKLPPWQDYAHTAGEAGETSDNPAIALGKFVRDIISSNRSNFRIVSPDEAKSNRLGSVFETTERVWMEQPSEGDTDLGPDGRVMEVLSEHLCQAWLEGYLLTGRHGFFSSYEAFIHIVDSMVNQYAKWIKVCKETEWRKPVASLNYILSSHVWQQDHNGFTHQDPGFLDHLVNKKSDTVRIYLPPDTNTLLSVADHCFKSRNYINVVVTGKKETHSWLTPEQASRHCAAGMGQFTWAGSCKNPENSEVVLACAGDVPTKETIAAANLLKAHAPKLKFHVVNVVDLLTLQTNDQHPHGKSDAEFHKLFPEQTPVVFAFHGYPWLIHRLIYDRPTNRRFDVHGYHEEGGTTTPFDMLVQNKLDRYSILQSVANHIADTRLSNSLKGFAETYLSRHHNFIRIHGKDIPEVAYIDPDYLGDRLKS